MLPRQSPSVFDGDTTKWPGWISIWKNLVDDVGILDSQKSVLLQQYLSEKVKKEIGIALYNPGMYREVMRMLKANYGLPEMIATKHLDTLLNCHALAEGDRKGLSQFILNIRSTVARLSHFTVFSIFQMEVVDRGAFFYEKMNGAKMFTEKLNLTLAILKNLVKKSIFYIF
jgi:hypothetical protein